MNFTVVLDIVEKGRRRHIGTFIKNEWWPNFTWIYHLRIGRTRLLTYSFGFIHCLYANSVIPKEQSNCWGTSLVSKFE